MGGGTDNAKREDTKMTSRLKAIVKPFNKKRRGKKTGREKGLKGKIMNLSLNNILSSLWWENPIVSWNNGSELQERP